MNGKHTVLVAKVKIRMTVRDSNSFLLPLIFIGDKLLDTYANYAYQHRRKSQSWHQKSASAVALFIKYLAKRRKNFPEPFTCFKTFVDDLEFGTIDLKTGEDPTGLFWSPKSSQGTSKIIGYITRFNEYNYQLAEHAAIESHTTTKAILLNKKVPASFAEKQIKLAAWHHKHSNAFLPHILKLDQNDISSVYEVKSQYHKRATPLYTFPKDRIFDLIDAFRTKTKSGDFIEQHNLRDMLITMLLHFGGLRMSEPFHLFVEDIMENPNHNGEALVKLYHPESRRDQLAKMGLRPRTDPRNPFSYRAGWKNKDIDEVTVIQWFPVEAGVWFWELWVLYMTTQRAEPPYDKVHPFAFTKEGGAPASYQSFGLAHRRAVERIGLVVAKNLGTTRHAHRHTYASGVWEATRDPVILQKVLRHSNPQSQFVYIHPSDQKIRDALNSGFATLKKMATEHNTLDMLANAMAHETNPKFQTRLTEYAERGRGVRR